MKNLMRGMPLAILFILLLCIISCDNSDDPVASTAGLLIRTGDAGPDEGMSLLWMLNTDEEGLEALLEAQHAIILEGGLPRYLKPWELSERFGASQNDRSKLESFLGNEGIDVRFDITGSFGYNILSVRQIQRLLNTTVGRYVVDGCSGSAEFLMADMEPVIPSALKEIVPAVTGLRSVPLSCMEATTEPGPSPESCDFCQHSGTARGSCGVVDTGFFTPNQLNTAYGVDFLHSLGLKGSGTRAALISNPVSENNFKAFLKCFPDLFTTEISVVYHFSPPHWRYTSLNEGTLDLQALVWAAPRVDQIDFYEGGYNAASAAHAMGQVLSQNPLPDVLSVSWGFSQQQVGGKDPELPPIASAAWENYQKMIKRAAAAGITLFFAAGDSGSTYVSLPASSPFVTAVGGTHLLLDETNHIVNQGVWNSYLVSGGSAAGGGGATNQPNSPMPRYQYDTPGISGKMFAEGKYRLAPDVTAYASETPGISLYLGDENVGGNNWAAGNGTSFATPYTAGAALLLAQAVKQLAGWDRLGHLNPFLYSAARKNYQEYFSDVTEVNNNLGPDYSVLSPNSPDCCVAGPGYDKASGLGSIRFESFVTYLIGFTE